jgi:LytS/YehU family sensor histidine kinase
MILSAASVIFYIIKLREKSIKKQDKINLQMSELKMHALQSQMNPHFIFNSLNSIQNYIVNNDVMNAAIYLSKFSRLIRRILDNSNHTLLPFEQIIETLKMYVEMEAFRFNNEFTYNFIIDEELMNLQLPPMLLQPFVENAIWHGLMPKKGPKQLLVKAYRLNSNLICMIEDNGIGRNMHQKKEGHTSRGENMTKGMIESLKHLQGIDAQLQIIDKKENDMPAGTSVIVTIPVNHLS